MLRERTSRPWDLWAAGGYTTEILARIVGPTGRVYSQNPPFPEKFKDGTKRDAMKNFVKWAITDGQNDVEALSYAKLPKEVVDKELKALGKVM